MKNSLTGMFDIGFPLFAFSHCRDVVVAVSKSGGIGVFGAMHYTPEQLHEELLWIEERLDGRSYGIDLVIPERYVRDEGRREFDAEQLWRMIPDGHARFANELCDRFDVPALGEGVSLPDTAGLGWSESFATALTDIGDRCN